MSRARDDLHEKRIRQFTPQTFNYIKIIREYMERDTIIINNISESLGMDL